MKIPTVFIFAALTVDASAQFGQFMEQKRNVQLTNDASDRPRNVKQKLCTGKVALIQERIAAIERVMALSQGIAQIEGEEEELSRKGRFASSAVSIIINNNPYDNILCTLKSATILII